MITGRATTDLISRVLIGGATHSMVAVPIWAAYTKGMHWPHIGTNVPLRDPTPNSPDLGFDAFGLKVVAHRLQTPSITSFPDSDGSGRKVWEPSHIQDLVWLHPWLTNFHLGTVCVLHIRSSSVLDLVWRSWCSWFTSLIPIICSTYARSNRLEGLKTTIQKSNAPPFEEWLWD
jgi:hypothetical protein